MTRIGLKLLSARVDRLERIVLAIQALEDCRYETDCEHAQANLKMLLDSIPDEQHQQDQSH